MSTAEAAGKLALGTVQFGLSYGVANREGKVARDEAGLIIEAARRAGVKVLDTAAAYGESEEVLGSFDLRNFSIVTKFPELPANCEDVSAWAERQLSRSLDRLGVSSVYALLLHRPGQLLGEQGNELFDALCKLRDRQLVRRIGVSIYEPSELDDLSGRFTFDLIQAPFNVIDKRLLKSGWLDRLHEAGCEVHVRSVFMQGLLLMPPDERPSKFQRWAKYWDVWDRWLREVDQSPVEACLRNVLADPRIDRVLIGVDSLSQLENILESFDGPFRPAPAELECSDVELLNPSLWSQL